MSGTQVEIRCSCGSEKFDIPKHPRPSDIVKCARCGATGSFTEVIGQATSQAQGAFEKQLKDVFRKAGFK